MQIYSVCIYIYIFITMFEYINIYIYIYATCNQLQSEFPCIHCPRRSLSRFSETAPATP